MCELPQWLHRCWVLILVGIVSTGKILLQLLQTKVALILLDANVFNSKQLGKYIESTEALVAFKLSIDLPQNALKSAS